MKKATRLYRKHLIFIKAWIILIKISRSWESCISERPDSLNFKEILTALSSGARTPCSRPTTTKLKNN
jgi:hypothetical protein